ncbi:growth/differentiation factor 2 [Megalops cyprinoides]|uniref:growth/differentiation factor 2 n=1 Tax=Megalops cyprinoides TaxID=118141 RepID=UPI00186406BB|nr:growth/differentiation factor 2 [Megalops cyprinoides]
MQSLKSLLFPVCFSLMLSVGYCRCKPLTSLIQKEEAEVEGLRRSSERDLTRVEDEDMRRRQRSFLGNMKEEFLRKLNLSGVPQEHSKIDPPQFMVELYNRYASDKSTMPRSDVVRSFLIQDVIHSEKNGNRSKHRLLFNVSIPGHEEVTMAELRLFSFPDKRSAACGDIRATIKIYKVEHSGGKPTLRFLSGKDVEGARQSWEAFDVTEAIQAWVRLGHGAHELEVQVERRDCRAPRGGGGGGLDVSVSLRGNSSAILIIFSDDLGSRRREARKELRDMILHEEESVFSGTPDAGANRDLAPADTEADAAAAAHPRRRRQARTDYCRRTSLRVNFKDIGWDKWIVAPVEYDAFECRGICYFPLTDDVTPSKHALIQTLVNLSNPKKANMACCVPTKLDPITVLYQENGIITVRHLYEEMKVAQCGCR